MNLDETKELAIRTFIVNKAIATLPTEVVFRTRKLFASPQDFAARTDQTYTDTFKAHYLMVSFANVRDDATKGCDDDPVKYVTYLLQLYRDSQEEKTSLPNSHDMLVSDTMKLTNAFLQDRVIIANKQEHQALVQAGDMIKVQLCEHIVGTVGDWINFRLTVEVNS